MSVARLGAMRFISVALMLVQNLLIVRFLSLDEIGKYYLIVTIAYLGNAIVFVGADFYLQKRNSSFSVDHKSSVNGLLLFIVVTAVAGGSLVWSTSAYYFYVSAQNWFLLAFLCGGLAVGNYLSGLGRNLLQLAAQPVRSGIGPIVEGVLKVLLIIFIVASTEAVSGVDVAVIGCIATWVAGIITLKLFVNLSINTKVSYLNEPRRLLSTLIPIGGGGFLNWVQLQSYRPLIAVDSNGVQAVGAISLLSTLGSILSNSVFSILAQLEVPRQYQSNGISSIKYLQKIALLAALLCLLCIPGSMVFLWLTGKVQLMGLVYFVVLGVLIEAGNSIIGVCVNHLNIIGRSMWYLPVAGLAGSVFVYGFLFLSPPVIDVYLKVAVALFFGQLIAVCVVLATTYRISKRLKYVE